MAVEHGPPVPPDESVRKTFGLDAGLDKLQAYLLAMSPGEELNVSSAATISALPRDACARVLDALARAGLLMRLPSDAYVRATPINPQSR